MIQLVALAIISSYLLKGLSFRAPEIPKKRYCLDYLFPHFPFPGFVPMLIFVRDRDLRATWLSEGMKCKFS